MNLIIEKHTNRKYSEATLALDIGGTTTQVGIVGTKNKHHEIIYTTELWTEKIKIYSLLKYLIAQAESNLGIRIKATVIAIATKIPPKRNFAIMKKNKVNIKINRLKLEHKTNKKIYLINDFEALGYSINELDNSKIKQIMPGQEVKYSPKIIVGAGTGLGKATLIYDKNLKKYIVLPSEGSVSDYPCQDLIEIELKKQITKNKRRLTQEDLLSGNGIQNIYKYLYENKNTKITKNKYSHQIKKDKYNVFLIEKYKTKDPVAKETLKLFSIFYARMISNYFTETLSYGGIYIAGGLAIRNPEILGKEFETEFNKNKKAKKFINQTPLYVLTNKNLSLIGAAIYSETKR